VTVESVPIRVEPVEVLVNGRWPVKMPPHRAERPEWHTPPYWEGARLNRMWEVVSGLTRKYEGATGTTFYDGPTIWDVGAEEGDMPALYSTWGADVVLIEPNPRVWPCIRYHWTANDLPGPAGCFVGLVGSPEQVNDVWTDPLYEGWPEPALSDVMWPAHGFHHLQDYATVDPVTTLDALLPYFPTPDVITADIEGGEGHMLAGATTMLSDIRPVWFVSVHSTFMRDMYNQDPQTFVFDVFARHGYDRDLIEDRHEAHWIFTP